MGLRLYLSEKERLVIANALANIGDETALKLYLKIKPIKKEEVKKAIEVVYTSVQGNNSVHKNIVATNRPNNNDCWNVAIALACNESYELVRKRMTSSMSSRGGMPSFHTRIYLEKHGYEVVVRHGYKTPLSMARDTESTQYEYVVSTTGHVVYVRHGKIYDSFESDRKRIKRVMRRKISKNRKSIHSLIS